MKLLRKVFIITFCIVFTMFSTVGCGKKKNEYDQSNQDQIKVSVDNRGYGVEMIKQIAKAFETTHPGKTVHVSDTTTANLEVSQIEAGSFVADVCMYMIDKVWSLWREDYITPITDVVNSIPEGEDETVYAKTNKQFIDAYRVADGNFYSIPFTNETMALAYNKTVLDAVFGQNGWTLPTTSYDLFKMCDRIQSSKNVPNPCGFIWSGSYLNSLSEVWNAQYSGIKAYNNYFDGYYYDNATSKWTLSDNAQCYESNIGRLRSLEAAEKIVKNYAMKYTSNMSMIEAQATWVGAKYNAENYSIVFTPIGDWVYEETAYYIDRTNNQIGYMKAPVLSSVVEQLDLYQDGTTAFENLTSIKKQNYDDKLKEIIDYVDGVTTVKPAYSDHDIEWVRDARQMIYGKTQCQAFIPSNSNKKDLAKEFLLFMTSDMAVDIYSKATNGFSPFISSDFYDNIAFNDNTFMNEVCDVLSKCSIRVILPYNDLKTSGYYLPKVSAYISGLGTKTAQAYFNEELTVLKEEWSQILKNSGLKADADAHKTRE